MNCNNFIDKNCKNCKNKNTQLCSITVNINGEQQCVYHETNKEVLE